MRTDDVLNCLECNPVIAAVGADGFEAALCSPAQMIFHLGADISSVQEVIRQAHAAEKYIFIHLDLAAGIGTDRAGVGYLAQCGADGIVSTRSQIIRYAKEYNLVTVQRFFLLDSKGLDSIEETVKNTNPHLMELMPGVIGKAISRFSRGKTPVIAGGLIETKAEITAAISSGATAISTGSPHLWEL